MTEDEAVSAVGSVDDVAARILDDVPLVTLARERVRSRRKMSAWEIVLLVLGSPLWLSLLAAAFAVILALYAVLWSLIVFLWAVLVSLWGSAAGALFGGVVFVLMGKAAPGVLLIGCAMIFAGLSLFLLYGTKLASVGAGRLTRHPFVWLRCRLSRKECFE